ncbi:MAG TPA: tetratricopeptide repeat protein [Candidatus Acidoferrum sp.]|nr:tetratricopeptide repeat protein [Candidatus Acidoferrum sp.]
MQRFIRRLAPYVLLLQSGSGVALGHHQQTPPAIQVATEAASAYDAKNWSEAAKLYGQIVQAAPNPRAWYRLGVSLNKTGDKDKAIEAFEKGRALGLPPQFAEYGIATVFASKKEKDRAFEHLEKAAQNGFSQPDQLSTDTDLAELKSDARFAKILEIVTHNQKPCAYAAENRQFDFWLGEWSVVTSQGETPAGDSRIEPILGDCVVQENWTSAGNVGYSGKSYNIYNAALKRWEQYWVDNSGGNIFFYGGLKDGVMDYWTDEIPQPDGKKLKRHLQFIKLGPDKVRQFSQGSNDAGKTWFVEYDFTYNRKK